MTQTHGDTMVAGSSGDGYFMFHRRRYRHLLELIESIPQQSGIRCLDVGRSAFTDMLRDTIDGRVDTLGLEPDDKMPQSNNYCFDLNDCQDERLWRTDLDSYGLIVMAEVIEHLYTSPEFVLRFLRSRLAPGGRLIIQTPNAAAFENRVGLLLGRNPFPLIANNRRGHYRELTSSEIRQYAKSVNLEVESLTLHRYFDARYRMRMVDGVEQHAPPNWRSHMASAAAALISVIPSFRPGITCLLRRPGNYPRVP